FLTTACIKDTDLALLQRQLTTSTNMRLKMLSSTQIVNKIISCWVAVAKASRLSFSFTFTNQTYLELDKALKIEHIFLLKLFPGNFNNLPNLHINQHHVQNARNFGPLVNISVGVKEAVHKIFKSSVSKMNCKNIEFDLIRRHNTLQMIRYLIDRGKDSCFQHIGQGFRNFTVDPLLQPILSDWYMTQNIQDIQEDTADISTNITSHDDKIRNIKTRKRLSKREIHQLSLPVKLDDNLQFTYDIISAYDIYMEKRAALIHRRVEFYKQISYTLLNDDGTFDMHMNLHSGDIVQIQEETGLSYAILKGIFTHKYNDGLVYSFIWIDWLRECLILDPILQCPVYEKQTAENTRWHQVYPISLIDNLSKIHFVHHCHSTCTSTLHDPSNNQYVRNEFYYEAI
ncbi:14031_t:CDS:2, partial [Gigaspora margarita]